MRRLLALALLATAACSDAPDTPHDDAGTRPLDAALARDAALTPDAGTIRPPEWPHPVGTWVEQVPEDGIPGFSWEAGSAYDPVTGLWLHHAGHDGIPQGFHLFSFDTDAPRWRQLFPEVAPGGACTLDGAATFDRAHRRFVRLPAGYLGHGYQFSRSEFLKHSWVWLYDPDRDAWTNMRPPPYSSAITNGPNGLNQAATYDLQRGLVLASGGITSSGGTDRMFAYDAHDNFLEDLSVPGRPAPRDGHGFAHDARSDSIIVFGGQYLDDPTTYVYRYDTGAWEAMALDPHPPTAISGSYSTIPKLACEDDTGRCLCVTWDPATNLHQTWVLDTSSWAWSQLTTPDEIGPSMSRSRNLAFASDKNVFFLETMIPGTSTHQIWSLRLAPRADSLAPPAELTVTTTEAGATLTWTPAFGATRYRIERATAETIRAAVWSTADEVAATTWHQSGLTPGENVFYRVRSLDAAGAPSVLGRIGRTRPRVLLEPIVSAISTTEVRVRWDPHPAPDVVGYHVYRGVATVRTVTEGMPVPWRDNDPLYAEPHVAQVTDVTAITRLTSSPLATTSFVDTAIDLSARTAAAGDHRYAVHAYIVRAVNALGVESGPSPYALTIPAEPRGVMLRELGATSEIRWSAPREEGIVGHRLYRLGGEFVIVPVGTELLTGTSTTVDAGTSTTRYWIAPVDALGQEGTPSSPVWANRAYRGFFEGDWHQ
jgi:hypothetical protein